MRLWLWILTGIGILLLIAIGILFILDSKMTQQLYSSVDAQQTGVGTSHVNFHYSPTESNYYLVLKKFNGLEKWLVEDKSWEFANDSLYITLVINDTVYQWMKNAVENPTMDKCLIAEPYVQEDYPNFDCSNSNHRDLLLTKLDNFITKGFKVVKAGIDRGYINKDGDVIEIIIPIGEINRFDMIEIGESSIQYQIDEFTTIDSRDTNITQENNFSHLTISEQAPYNSLVLYMPFDVENKSTSVYDWSKYNNDGTISGNPVWNLTGKYGGAMEFDGDGDYVEIADDTSLNTYNKNFTILAWVKGKPYDSTDDMIITRVEGAPLYERNYRFGIGGYNAIHLSTRTGETNYEVEAQPSGFYANSSAMNNWHFVGMVWNGSISFYLDGSFTPVSTGSMPSNAIGNPSSASVFIGQALGSSLFNGSIDEVMIFNTSLTSQQVLDIYNNQSARFKNPGTQEFKQFNFTVGNNTVNVSSNNIQRLYGSNLSLRLGYWNVANGYNNSDSGLAGYWHYDNQGSAGENSTLAYDWSGNGNNGTAFNGASVTSNSVYLNAFKFDGVNDYINSSGNGISGANVNSSTFTWVYISGTSLSGAFVHLGTNNNGFSFGVGGTTYANKGNDVIILIDLVRWIDTNKPIGTGWHQVGVVMNTTGIPMVYIDGIYKGSFAGTGANAPNNQIIIGGDLTAGRYFNGSLDEVMVFNRTLSNEEIKQLYIKGRANWQYTDYQNVSSSNNSFSIDSTSTNILPEYQFLAGTSTNTFYSPVLESNIDFDFYTSLPADASPVVTLSKPSNNYGQKQGEVIFECNMTDDSNLQNVTLYVWNSSGGVIFTNFTNVTGLTNVSVSNYTFAFDNVTQWNCLAYDNGTNSAWADSNFTLTIDSVPPYFTDLLNASFPYLTAVSHDINGSDDGGFGYFSINDIVNFTINPTTGLIQNKTVLGVGAYNINVTINDTAGNQNSTIVLINVTKIKPALSLTINPSTNVKYKTETTANGSGCPGQLICNLSRDGVYKFNPEVTSLSAGTYVYEYNTSGNANYTNASVFNTLTVTSAQFGKNLSVWKNASTGLDISYVDNEGNWWIFGDLVIEGTLFGGVRVELETVQAECIGTDQNELLAWDVIRHTVTAEEADADEIYEWWDKAPKNKIVNLALVVEGVWVYSFIGEGMSVGLEIVYDGSSIYIADISNTLAAGNVVVITVTYENC